MAGEKVYLTFDLDWSSDEVIQFVLDKLAARRFKATLFVIEPSPLIERLKGDRLVELGIHPDFNDLMAGQAKKEGSDIEQRVRRMKDLIPEAVSVRSHCLTQGTVLSNVFKRNGLLFDCNPYIPFVQVPTIRPWRFWTGTTVVPFVWSDFIDLLRGGNGELNALLGRRDAIKAVAFHPLLVYLNTPSYEEYQRYRQSGLTAPEFRAKFGDEGRPGAGRIFDSFLDAVAGAKMQTAFVREVDLQDA